MILPFAFHWVSLVTWPCLAAREAEKCSLYSKIPCAHLKCRDSVPAEEENGDTKG